MTRGTIVDNIESTISKNSILGMVFSFVSGTAATLQQTDAFEVYRHTIVSLAADLGIVVGLFIGLLTLLIKTKDFYKTFFKEDKSKKDNDNQDKE